MKTNSGFFEKVYDLVRKIPEGKVTTYGEIARALGTKDSRRIGHALHANPDSSLTPCHRVVAKDGKLAPGYAFGGPNEQRNKLTSEGIIFADDVHVDLKKCMIKLA